MRYQLDVARLVSDLGGRRSLPAKLEAAKLPVPAIKTIDKWIERGSIPARRLIELLVLARYHMGLAFDLLTYVTPINPRGKQ